MVQTLDFTGLICQEVSLSGFPGEERYPLIYPAFPWLCLSKLASLFYITYHKSAYSDLICRKICRKNSVVFTLSSNEAHLGYDCNTHAVPSDFLYSIAYFFTKIKEPAYCGKLLLFILSWFFLQAQQPGISGIGTSPFTCSHWERSLGDSLPRKSLDFSRQSRHYEW